ncbi:hypothetical protein Goarm_000847 [Gossypium armourianum]|uniref:Uncharacterized protein n=1 Tax=Gossypium armourianum TaxID=34283 RepID=A0A7J9KBB3_9ROSI|nr:hypothetical protein [Gossypium armourianum]
MMLLRLILMPLIISNHANQVRV